MRGLGNLSLFIKAFLPFSFNAMEYIELQKNMHTAADRKETLEWSVQRGLKKTQQKFVCIASESFDLGTPALIKRHVIARIILNEQLWHSPHFPDKPL